MSSLNTGTPEACGDPRAGIIQAPAGVVEGGAVAPPVYSIRTFT